MYVPPGISGTAKLEEMVPVRTVPFPIFLGELEPKPKVIVKVAGVVKPSPETVIIVPAVPLYGDTDTVWASAGVVGTSMTIRTRIIATATLRKI
jgi:hypothetical protein